MSKKIKLYTCSMHPEIIKKKPGKCPICGGMDLVETESSSQENEYISTNSSYARLYIVVGLITLTSIVALYNGGPHQRDVTVDHFMMNFMAGYFLVFSGFKLLDIQGFSKGFATYDLLAQKVFQYGYIYPFIELLLGLSYLTHYQPFLTNILALILMTFSGIGVALKLYDGEKFKCACLGTFLNVPLSKITLIEDFAMAGMALFMLH